MSIYKYNSWGRTRSPKSAARIHVTGSYITGSGVQSDGAVGGLPALTQIGIGSEAQGIYITENQRYMHLHCSGSDSGIVGVYGYTHASKVWSELVTGSVGTPYGAVKCGENQHRVVEISGIDYISVVTGSSTKLKYANFVAFSTF